MSSAKTLPTPLHGLQSALVELADQVGQLIAQHQALAVAGAAGAVALLVAGWAWSALVGRRALARRQGLVLVPTEGFDPGVEEVLRFAAALAGCRPARLAPRWSRAVRVHLSSARGQLAYSIEGPPWLMPVLRSGTFSQVELRPASALGTIAMPTGSPAAPGASLEAGAAVPPFPQPAQQEDQTVEDDEILAQ
jgi:hypothetical protein